MDIYFFKAGLLSLLLIVPSFGFAGPFDELDSYDRQQRAADDAFNDFEKEFGEPARPAHVQPKQKPQPKPEPARQVRETPRQEPKIVKVKQQTTASSVKHIDRIYEQDDLLFTFKGCIKNHNEVRCALTVLSEKTDLDITLDTNNSTFFDNNGNQYKSHGGKIANKKTSAPNWGGRATHKLIRGVTTKTKVEFPNISHETNKISLIEIKFHTDSPIKLVFRDVPFI